MNLDASTPIAVRAIDAIRKGHVDSLRELLDEAPDLVAQRITDARCPGEGRTLLHIATDWPGHFPNGPETVSLLAERGADLNARFVGSHAETPLHWAASSNDVAMLDRLLDLGADIDAGGGVIAGGTPLTDAVAFGQWNAARRLVERRARIQMAEAAALGLLEQVKALCSEDVGEDEINRAFWMGCHGGARETAEYLLDEYDAELNWLASWEKMTPLDAARRSGFYDVAEWLRERGATTAAELA